MRTTRCARFSHSHRLSKTLVHKKMTLKKQLKRLLTLLGIICLILGSIIITDYFLLKQTNPIGKVKTLSEFKEWKGTKISEKYLYQTEETTYTVYLAPAGRSFASGKAAYLFDENENFIDWSADLGDLKTQKLKLKLNNVNLKLDEH